MQIPASLRSTGRSTARAGGVANLPLRAVLPCSRAHRWPTIVRKSSLRVELWVVCRIVDGPSNDVDWTTERCLSLTDMLIEGKLLELATSRARHSFATRLAKRLNENADLSELADWIVEQAEVVELHASDDELQAAIEAVAADELDDLDAGEDANADDADEDDGESAL